MPLSCRQIPSLLVALALGAAVSAATSPVATPGAAQVVDDEADLEVYSQCLSMAGEAPEDALEIAIAWEQEGGRNAASHCAAVALLGLGRFDEAGESLERLAESLQGDDKRLTADVMAQAGQAWLLQGDAPRAYRAQTEALRLDGENVELWIDRAITLAAADKYWEAIDDLNRADELVPGRADILIFRASAYRFVEAFDLALEDVNRGLRAAPNHPEGLLERGILHRLTGNNDGAREDWLQVVILAQGTPAADAAQANLAALDVKVE